MDCEETESLIALPPSPGKDDMRRFEIQPVLDATVAEVADFLHRQTGEPSDSTFFQSSGHKDCLSIEKRLRWLLFGNPLTREDPHGFCVRDSSGTIRGLTLCFPSMFLVADWKIRGLGSGSFAVDPQTRTAGLFLFKKYLRSPGCSFFFATTCNAKSAALWRLMHGCPVPNSELEYILPLKLDTLLPALLAGGTSNGAVSAIAQMFGRCATPILQLLERQSTELAITPCQDWEKLSDLFHRHRPKDWITTDRSAEFLQWRYEQSADLYPSDVYLFRDKRGNEGWFSLASMARGRQGQIQGSVLLDAIWPREKMSFRDLFPGIVQLVAANTDALFFRPRPGLDCGECSRWIIPRRWPAPTVFAITRAGYLPIGVASLDLVDADGDSTLPILPGTVSGAM